MSSRALGWAFNQQVSHIYKSTLLALAEYANGDGLVSEYQEVLAADAGCDARTLRRHLARLEEMGFITRAQQKRPDGGKDKCEIQLLASDARRVQKTPPSGQNVRTPPVNLSGQETSFIPLEVKDVSSINTSRPSEASASDLSATDVGAGPSNIEPRTSNTTPDGAASGEAREASLSSVGSTNVHQEGGNVNVKGPENVPPAATTYRAALGAIDGAGLTTVWVQWIKLNQLRQVSQEAQIGVWKGWIDAGLGDELRTQATDIIECGSFAHPWGGLKARMQKAQAALIVKAQVDATFGPAQVAPGERRVAPDGQAWTVEVVEFGIVYFEEIGAPTDMGDRLVSRWPLEVRRD